MALLFLLQMAYHLISPALHEWLGSALFVLLILHNILDWRWYAGLRKGRYTAKRIFHTSINFLLLISCLGVMISAVCLSSIISRIFHLQAALLGRKLHMACTTWSFILMSAHVGIHWNMVIGALRKRTDHSPYWCPIAGKITALLLSSYGIYTFWERGLLQRAFLLSEYVFFDYNEPLPSCLIAYGGIQCLFAAIVYYLSQWLAEKVN